MVKTGCRRGSLQAYLSLDRLQDEGAFGSWFCGIVLNLCRSHLRARRVDHLSWEALAGGVYTADRVLVDSDPTPEEESEIHELHQQMLEAVEELSPKVRRTVLLYYFEELSQRDIAALLCCTVSAVKGRLNKARQELRDRLGPLFAAQELRKKEDAMTRVEIADVIEQDQNYRIILLDRENKRSVFAIVGNTEGRAIVSGLKGISMPRPMTAQFAASIIDALGANLEEVRIEKLVDTTIYAVAKIRSGDTVKELDARPSDAMAVGVLAGSPLYVADEVWEKAGTPCTDEEMAALGGGLNKSEAELRDHIANPPTIQVTREGKKDSG